MLDRREFLWTSAAAAAAALAPARLLAAVERHSAPVPDLSTWSAVRAQFALEPGQLHFSRPCDARRAMEAAYATAREAVRGLFLDEATRQQVRVGRRFAVEAARIGEYYNQVIKGLERRLDRERGRSGAALADNRSLPAGGDATGDRAGRADALTQKVEASRLERERKLRELGETCRIRARAQMASVRLLWQPRVYFQVLLDRGPVTRSLTLAYDGILERLELPTCESCRRSTSRLRASSIAKLLCPACSGEESSPKQG